MCENERITASLIEPVRGLLADEEFERWNIEALDQWLNGQRKTPIQRRPATKPKAPFKFGARDHMTVRSIAQAFSKNVPEAIKIIRSGKLEHWLRTSIDAPEIADSLLEIMTIPKGHEASLDAADDVLVSKVCMRLDPHGPIRFKHFSFLPDGFGVAMAVEYLRKGNFQIPGEVLARDLIGFWATVHEKKTVEISATERTFVSLRNFARINEMGYGMERCLYELNQTLPCQSPLLNKTYVDHIDDFLFAMDEIADHTDKRSRPMDKHIAAFIDTHFKYDVTPHLKALSDPHEETSLIGLLSLYALMQWRMKVPALYGLSSWLGGLLAPAIGTYHSRTTDTNRNITQALLAFEDVKTPEQLEALLPAFVQALVQISHTVRWNRLDVLSASRHRPEFMSRIVEMQTRMNSALSETLLVQQKLGNVRKDLSAREMAVLIQGVSIGRIFRDLDSKMDRDDLKEWSELTLAVYRVFLPPKRG